MAKNWEEIGRLAEEYAIENLNSSGMNCAESVFEALIRSGALDVPKETLACATAFGGGGGCSGYTCGALASAFLANSMVHGRRDPMSTPVEERRPQLKNVHYRRHNGILSDFRKDMKYGTCGELVGQFEEGYMGADTRQNCIKACGVGARVAVKYLQMSNEECSKLPYDTSVVGIPGWTE